jgi:hypothetical protein
VRALVAQARRGGAVKQISSYQDPGGAILVSADRNASSTCSLPPTSAPAPSLSGPDRQKPHFTR